jgi:homotetrameric cytidine deaminase
MSKNSCDIGQSIENPLVCFPRKDIDEIQQLGRELLKYETIEDIAQQALIYVYQKLAPQVCSIFLIGKSEQIERFAIMGEDINGKKIDDSWLKEDDYYIIDSENRSNFSATAASPKNKTSYGEPYLDNNLDQKQLKNGQAYIDKLGCLKCGISVPLDSKSRTIGTIEALNKRENPETGIFTEEELEWLNLVGMRVSEAINRVRVHKEREMYTNLIGELTDPSLAKAKEQVYEEATKILIDRFMPYNVCILRLLNGENLDVAQIAHTSDVKMPSYQKLNRQLNDGSLSSFVAQRNQEITSKNLIEERYDLAKQYNLKDWKDFQPKSWSEQRSWINEENCLKSFTCFPLSASGKVIGTLSLFTGYEHHFSANDIKLLQTISRLLAIYTVKVINQNLSATNHRNSEEDNYKRLIQEAKNAAEYSYSPYSRFPVGAAVMTGDGSIYTGTNIENISFSMTLCAERLAIFKAVSSGKPDIKAIAVYSSQGVMPCGACRQVLLEFAPNCKVIIFNGKKYKANTLSDLLPEPFDSFY